MWWRTSNCSPLLIYRPWEDERLSWPDWLTYSGCFTHISGHPSATGRAQDGERTLARDWCSAAEPHGKLWMSVHWKFRELVVIGVGNRQLDFWVRCLLMILCGSMKLNVVLEPWIALIMFIINYLCEIVDWKHDGSVLKIHISDRWFVCFFLHSKHNCLEVESWLLSVSHERRYSKERKGRVFIQRLYAAFSPVSYTHLTLPTKRIV